MRMRLAFNRMRWLTNITAGAVTLGALLLTAGTYAEDGSSASSDASTAKTSASPQQGASAATKSKTYHQLGRLLNGSSTGRSKNRVGKNTGRAGAARVRVNPQSAPFAKPSGKSGRRFVAPWNAKPIRSKASDVRQTAQQVLTPKKTSAPRRAAVPQSKPSSPGQSQIMNELQRLYAQDGRAMPGIMATPQTPHQVPAQASQQLPRGPQANQTAQARTPKPRRGLLSKLFGSRTSQQTARAPQNNPSLSGQQTATANQQRQPNRFVPSVLKSLTRKQRPTAPRRIPVAGPEQNVQPQFVQAPSAPQPGITKVVIEQGTPSPEATPEITAKPFETVQTPAIEKNEKTAQINPVLEDFDSPFTDVSEQDADEESGPFTGLKLTDDETNPSGTVEIAEQAPATPADQGPGLELGDFAEDEGAELSEPTLAATENKVSTTEETPAETEIASSLPQNDEQGLPTNSDVQQQPTTSGAPKLVQTQPSVPPAPLPTANHDEQTMRQLISSRKGPNGMKGFCPVTLRDQHQLTDSKVAFYSIYRGQRFHFSSATAREKFESDPDRYAPVLGGVDVILLSSTGESKEGSLENAVWYKGRLFLFNSENTMETFSHDPGRYAPRNDE